MAVNSFHEERETPEYATIAELADNVVYRIPSCDNETVRRMLAEHEELFFEADDTDPAAMALMSLFDRSPIAEYDTYILE